MLDVNEKSKLCSEALSSGKVSQQSLDFLRKKYESSRDTVLADDAFFSDNPEDLYNLLRMFDSTSSDYIELLERRITYLEGLVVEYASGVVESNADVVKNCLL